MAKKDRNRGNKIDRRSFLTMIGAATAAIPAMPYFARSAENKTKQNVLLIGIDDLRSTLGCYGNDIIVTPNIDRLALEGVVFERAYAQQATCGPSRCSVFSGYRPESTGIMSNPQRLPGKIDPDEMLTLPQHFKNNGYETVAMGKVYHNVKDDLEGWSVPQYRAFQHPEEGNWNGKGYFNKETIDDLLEKRKQGQKDWYIGYAYEKAEIGEDGRPPDTMLADRAIQEMRRLKNKPFFMAVGFRKPHLPYNAPKEYWDLYDPQQLEMPVFKEKPLNAPDYALTDWGELRSYMGIPKEGELSSELARTLTHAYYACVSYVDAQIGRILDELERLGLRENTIIMLWSDHAQKLGDYNAWSKHTNFEVDTRVPMIVSMPGVKSANQRTSAIVENMDIYPSLCDLAGLPIPKHCEGLSVKPLLAQLDMPWKKGAFSLFPRNVKGEQILGRSIRTDRWRYVEWKKVATGEITARELYDHKYDPGETVNIASRIEHQDQVARLSKMLNSGWRKALPDEL